jgi:DNA-directed RNA polymerase specialized sigma24 family protein
MSGSITRYLRQLQDGSPEAAGPLWERYFVRLVPLARRLLHDTPRGMADEEDLALAALHSFCRGACAGRFPELGDRESLWRLLVVITWHKARHQKEREYSAKRGGGRVRCETDLAGRRGAGLDQVVSAEPTPELAALMADECRRLLACLEEDGLRAVALRKLEGYTNAEVARQLDCSLASVERKLRRIRGIWEEEAGA